MSRERNIPSGTSMLGAAGNTPKLVPEVGRLRVGARTEEQAAPASPEQSSGRERKVPSKAPGRPPRRRGRPRGPERVPLTVRILTSTDRKLTAAVEQTGLNPQTLVEQALEAHFRRLKVEDPGPEPHDGGVA